jgi:hypothetical protein
MTKTPAQFYIYTLKDGLYRNTVSSLQTTIMSQSKDLSGFALWFLFALAVIVNLIWCLVSDKKIPDPDTSSTDVEKTQEQQPTTVVNTKVVYCMSVKKRRPGRVSATQTVQVCGGGQSNKTSDRPKTFSAEYSAETNIRQVLPKTKKVLSSNFSFSKNIA